MKKPYPDSLDELLPAYALGVLEGPELAEVEARIAAGDPEVLARLDELRETVEALAESVEPIEPSEAARSAILAAVAEEATDGAAIAASPGPVAVPGAGSRRQEDREHRAAARTERPSEPAGERTKGGGRPGWLGWAAAAAAVVVAIWAVASRQNLLEEVEVLRDVHDRMELALVQAQESNAKALEAAREAGRRATETPAMPTAAPAVALLASPDTAPVLLAGLSAAPESRGRVFVDSLRGRAQLYVDNLPALPEGKEYQLWAIADGPPISAGVFRVDASGAATHEIPGDALMPRISSWAVTIEDTGGVPQPTGTMVLAGQA